jgi:TPP-dependent pyruvate/acetoin dehydrogenase alpha subunit
MYGVPCRVFDGNHVLDAYAAARLAVDRARAGQGATLLVAETFRMGGHATHDEREARNTFAPELFREWGRRDPVALYEMWLLDRGLPSATLDAIEADVTAEVESGAEEALRSRESAIPRGESVGEGVYGGGGGYPLSVT